MEKVLVRLADMALMMLKRVADASRLVDSRPKLKPGSPMTIPADCRPHPLFAGCLALVLLFSSVSVHADLSLPERRKNQFPDMPAHLIVPLPYSYPGIGSGYFLMGNFSNVLGTTDVLAMYV
ncbi:MAG TPA: hypothetical protein VGD24_09135, partial [Gallionella sp.]